MDHATQAAADVCVPRRGRPRSGLSAVLYDDALLDSDLERLLESVSEEEVAEAKKTDEPRSDSGDDGAPSCDNDRASPEADPKQQQVCQTVRQYMYPCALTVPFPAQRGDRL